MAYYPLSEFPPGHRLAWERDGSSFYKYRSDDTVNPIDPSEWYRFNRESNHSPAISTGIQGLARYWVVLLPSPVTLVGVFKGVSNPVIRFVEVSSDTTDGLDGSWTQIVDEVDMNIDVFPWYRDRIHQVSQSNVIGVRAVNTSFDSGSFYLAALHLYVASQETFLQMWHPALDEEIDPEDFDWGVLYAGEVHDRQFRIKNVRSLTAHDIEVTNLSYTNDSIDAAYDFSIDGGAFQRPLAIGNLGPGAISDVITQRLTLPENQIVTRYATQISAIPDSWSG